MGNIKIRKIKKLYKLCHFKTIKTNEYKKSSKFFRDNKFMAN